MKSFTIPDSVQLPPLSTDIPGRSYSFADFWGEFVMLNEHLRVDDALPALFAAEEHLSAKAGDTIELADDMWQTIKSAAKQLIDERMSANRLPMPWALKVLRLYHVLASAK